MDMKMETLTICNAEGHHYQMIITHETTTVNEQVTTHQASGVMVCIKCGDTRDLQ